MQQHIINEIHGGIFDPSNPVVKMSGKLRSDLFKDLLLCERKADLVLTLGSSLAGMNADRLVSTCSDRALRSTHESPVYGSVIVSLQTTPHDANAAVRIYATIDRTMELLAKQMQLDVGPPACSIQLPPTEHCHADDIFAVPYGKNGQRQVDSSSRILWDLRPRSIHSVTRGPNEGARAIILSKTDDGHYRVGIRLRPDFQGDYQDIRILGSWWVNSAVAGDVDWLPIVNRENE